MKLLQPSSILTLVALFSPKLSYYAAAFVPQQFFGVQHSKASALGVSIGLGPEQKQEEDNSTQAASTPDESVSYEIPNHEEYRLSRRSKIDEQCDEWFSGLLDANPDSTCLGTIANQARDILTTPVPLLNEVELPRDDQEWTPYVTTKLPWTPLTPSYGCEVFGVPVPRRNAEAWRHFDVTGMVSQSYAGAVVDVGKDVTDLSTEQVNQYITSLRANGGWLDDDACEARLVYLNGRFVPQLSKTSSVASNLNNVDGLDEQTRNYLGRLTDGFTDDLVVPVANGKQMQSSYQKLSGPNHNLGAPTGQFAINVQQGTACFAALNTVKTGSIAYVRASGYIDKPVLIVNAVSKSGGAEATSETGVACHPRTLVVADDGSLLSVVQSAVDFDAENESYIPKLYNGYTQVFVGANANVTHSYLDESGGMVTGGVEVSNENIEEGAKSPREVESERQELRDTHLEAIDVQIFGKNGSYEGTVMSIGGSGRIRIGMSVTLLQTGAVATVNGFSLSGGTQRTDMKTNIHHIAQGTESHQIQKNMIGGRATGAFRGRIRVEQSAQQTDSEQLSRTVLLSDKARAWAVPSLEIIADDVKCTHGATVSDLSEEEMFYLRSRGLSQSLARNLLMYAFACDIASCVDPAILGTIDGHDGLQQRVIRRLENLVPRGERAIKGEFQSI